MQLENRRPAAIVAADIMSYSRLIGQDEEGTLRALREHRAELIDPLIEQHGGRIANTAGDSLLLEFPSAVDAVRCSIAVQDGMAERNSDTEADRHIVLRIGINVGDVVAQGDDLLGDGVNVAARLEGLCEAGGLALSDDAHRQVRDRLEVQWLDGGEHEVKNIARPVHVWRWSTSVRQISDSISSDGETLPLPGKPSIAVLPFDNMSVDPEQEYFVDGVVEDILTTLSKVPQLFVIARNSSFKYKGKNPDVRDVGRELGVAYVVEGSVRKVGNRVRVTAQLVECVTGGHLWADRFDGDLDDVFELQDRITEEIVIALQVNLAEGETAKIWRQRSGSPQTYAAFQKAMERYSNFARESHRQTLQMLEDILATSPDYTAALYLYGLTLVDHARFSWTDDSEVAYKAALEAAEHALSVDPNYADAYSVISYAQSFQGQHEEAVAAAEQAVALERNNSAVFHMSAMTHIYAGNFETGRDYERQSGRLNPIDQSYSLVDLARAEYHLGEYEEARRLTTEVLQRQSRWLTAQTILLAALWRLGREDEARTVAATIKRGQRSFSVSRWAKGWPYRRAEDLAALMDPLREAGLPEE